MHWRTLRQRVVVIFLPWIQSRRAWLRSQEPQQRHRPPRGYHQLAQGLARRPLRLTQPSTFFLVTYQPRYSPSMSQVLAAVHEEKITAADWIAFWSFLVATPIVVWLVYAAKVKAAGKALPLEFAAWPVWEMFAGTVAYCAWAFALPNAPFSEYPWYSSALSGVAVLVGSTVLGLLSPFFQNPLTPRST